jgi:hydroxypyruvate isomerase
MSHRFAANLSMMFTEVPLHDRFERAAKAGFSHVELQFPYEATATELAARMKAAGVQMILHNLPPGDFAKGERGIACHPDRVAEFRAGVPKAIAYAQALGVPQLNCLVGIAPAGVDAATLRRTAIDNLRFAAAELKKAGLKLLIEPINNYDIPGFWLNHTAMAVGVIDEVGADNLYVQYDIYHAQRYEGELAATISRFLSRIGHIQLADNPGRNEPGTGEINYPFVLRHLKTIGYAGMIGAEYKPANGTEAGLGWLDWAVREFN